MNGGRIVADKNFSVSEEKYKELSSYVLKENDIVFGRRGDIGRCALVSKDEDGFICGTGSLHVRFDIEVDTTYILRMLLTNSIKRILIRNAKGATMLNINCGIVENLQIPLPPSPSPARVLLSHRADREAKDRGAKDHHRFGNLACIPNAVLV